MITRKGCYSLLFGQVISIMVVICGVSSTLLNRLNVHVPTTQSALNYMMLSTYLFRVYWKQPGTLRAAFTTRWRYYLPLALIDVEANFVVVKAFQYTSLSSVMLIDCFTIPCVMFLTWRFLGTRYGWIHVVGACICVLGIVLLAVADWIGDARPSSPGDNGSNPVLGDLLCLLGAVLYSVSNVSQEACVKKYSRTEFMGMLGVYGTAIGTVQIFLVEWAQLKAVAWSWPVVGCLALFWAGQFGQYSLSPTLLLIAGSAMFNLSLLSSDCLSLLAGVVIFGAKPSFLYFVSAGVIVFGLVVYNLAPDSDPPHVVDVATKGLLSESKSGNNSEEDDDDEEEEEEDNNNDFDKQPTSV